MSQILCVSIRFLDPVPSFHGQRDGGKPEWPPSPLRLFQAIVDAAASRWRESQYSEYAQPLLVWLERLSQPEIVTPTHLFGTPFRISGPNNDLDAPARKWVKGEEPLKPHRPMDLRTMKAVYPTHIRIGDGKHCDSLHYLFALPDGKCEHLEVLQAAARSITHLGWGIDMAVGDATLLNAKEVIQLEGVRWYPSTAGGIPLRVPKAGTLDDLTRKYSDFRNRVIKDGYRPIPPLRTFDIIHYCRDTDPIGRPHAVFKLVDENDDTVSYSHAKLKEISGMVRHVAIEQMKRCPPAARDLSGIPADKWIEQFVAGHKLKEDEAAGLTHAQFSYVPLPSTGHAHADPGIRRVMIVTPLGNEGLIKHLAKHLNGEILKPLPGTKLPSGTKLQLIPDHRNDGVREAYTRAATTWASFTPVILPGHDDHKPTKTHKLILKALAQSGIDQPCEFEWSAFSRFRKSYSAHKYDKNGQPQGYFRPDHLLHQTAIHLTIRFGRREEENNPESPWIPAERPVPGPLVIGAGRHCGFGLMAAVGEE